MLDKVTLTITCVTVISPVVGMAGIPDVDLFQIPLIALRTSTREIVSTLLNPMKVIPNSEGLPRDWRGLAQLTGMNNQMVILIGSKPDPTAQVLSQWRQGSIGLLKSYLGQLDRWDVVDDTENEMELDASHFLKRKNETKASAAELDAEIDKQILTIADVYQLEQGFEPQHYDAFLLYAEEDQDFAMQIVDKMERDYGLTLCLKDRDLIGGLTFEHEAIMRLIAKRCNRLIVVASPNFLKSEANKFFVTFATAVGIDQRLRKVVPVMYQRCQLPSELTYYFWLDYSRSGKLYDFWTKLHNSILSTTSAQPVKTQVPAIKANGEESISYKVQPALEQNKITSPNCVDERDESSADTCSLNTELLSIQSGRFDIPLLKKHKSLSVESLKAKSPRKWLKKILPKRKAQLAEAT
ncbi:myeloid differentiation primary response protein MyD88 [Periplaneta americana]|uniref:myeloid differentiation primary response protein MyD88 n=1 Tax=Periplaneta americana TaxID=6978 RepID=UPI0037E7D838